MKYTRLADNFETWSRTSENSLRNEDLLSQIDLFCFLKGNVNAGTDDVVKGLVDKRPDKYLKLLANDGHLDVLNDDDYEDDDAELEGDYETW